MGRCTNAAKAIFQRAQRKLHRKTEASSKTYLLQHEDIGNIKAGLLRSRKEDKQMLQARVNLDALKEAMARHEETIRALEATILAEQQAPLTMPEDKLEQLQLQQKALCGLLKELESRKDLQQRRLDELDTRHRRTQGLIVQAFDDNFVAGDFMSAMDDSLPSIDDDMLDFIRSADQIASGIPITDFSEEPLIEPVAKDEGIIEGPDKSANKSLSSDQRELIRTYRVRKAFLQQAEIDFEWRHESFEQQRQQNKIAREAGESAESTLSLDMRQLQVTRRLTRVYAEAEEKLLQTKNEAVAAGVQLPGSDLESGFVDDVHDGYRLSLEQELLGSVDTDRMEKWLATLPSVPCDPDSMPKLLADEIAFEEWEAASVEVWESGSVVAEGAERRRIDQWNALVASPGTLQSTSQSSPDTRGSEDKGGPTERSASPVAHQWHISPKKGGQPVGSWAADIHGAIDGVEK